MTRLVVVAMFVAAGCNNILGVHDFAPSTNDSQTDAPAGCDLAAHPLDAEGCACETVAAVQDCFLGDASAASRCHAGGVVTCQANHLWSACVGATAPVTESCFDGIDNDCDGIVDNGCSCGAGEHLCIDPATAAPYAIGESALVVPHDVPVGSVFSVLAMSRLVPTSELDNSTAQTDNGYCLGATSMMCSTDAGACAGWSGIQFQLVATISGTPKVFNGLGDHTVKIRVNDASAMPCSSTSVHMISATLVVQ